MGNRQKLNKTLNTSSNRSSNKNTDRFKKGGFRIIGGQWKGRKLNFIEVDGLRPSLDRVRETLFNWLQADIHHAKVLDLFAGSGALGIEALSRGADWVQFVELNNKAARQLANNLDLLTPHDSSLITGNALKFIETNQNQFDLIFLDPPFRKGIAQEVINLLSSVYWIRPDTLIYLETEQGLELTIPDHWYLLKDKKAGQLLYKLYRVDKIEQ
ncbi:16S rRNA (guanine(966)-N(2))-methyltransferase RsmD [Kangiella sp. HZ709]|uniref:16S rRNA (guanine(966)-N(2))-methyltransferase RsmD n=1 Tax=Kangiella sp. HZ709 TaxID=2666328 RepID=UPI0012B09F3A|nr:16S rRNA (guanine(966)-N(2))-methyltransferase RsmD [Kangiella sp. HZ709]MRX27856.1 16S rRNA (guanine(966)-N(2))-methyltransferase RsmD [Kangiella sp. HZ709]